MDQDAMQEAARLLALAWLERAPLEALPEAHAVQARLHGLQEAAGLGARVGWKIGCTTPVMQSYMGIDHLSLPLIPSGLNIEGLCTSWVYAHM